MNYFLVLALLGFVVTGCCSMKKSCPMKNHTAMATEEKMPMAAEAAAPVVENATAPAAEAMEMNKEEAAPAAQVAK